MSSQEKIPDDSAPSADADPAAADGEPDEPEIVVVNEPVDISQKPSFYDEGGMEQKSESIVDNAITNSKTNLESESATVAVAVVEAKPIPKHYIISDSDQGGSLAYEKDGNWVLAKVPPYSFRPKKDGTNNNETPFTKCCLEKDAEPPTMAQNIKAIYDVVIGADSVPCNECDKNMCKETLLQWLTSIVVSLTETVKELSAVIPKSSSACGSMDAETLKVNTKGTHADLTETNNPVATSTASINADEGEAPFEKPEDDGFDESQLSLEASKLANNAIQSTTASAAQSSTLVAASTKQSSTSVIASTKQSSTAVSESQGDENPELQIELVENSGDNEDDS